MNWFLKNPSFICGSTRIATLLFLIFCITAAIGQTSPENVATRTLVFESSSGSLCAPCYDADSLIQNVFQPAFPNMISLVYHGEEDDPFNGFLGASEIFNLLELYPFPFGTMDRSSGPLDHFSWENAFSNYNSVPAMVDIELVEMGYNLSTRELTIELNFRALTNLNGEYRYSLILVEDSILWEQYTWTDTIPDYLHNNVVRSMMNGAEGETIINGDWTENQVINKIFNYTLPTPDPEIIPENCRVVALVYQYGLPFSSNAEIQQATQWELVDPNYVTAASSDKVEFLGDNTDNFQYAITISNNGLLTDTYEIGISFTGPVGWMHSFTTANGIFDIGQTDQVTVAVGDSTSVIVEVSPNAVTGYGVTNLVYSSLNNAFIGGRLSLKLLTYGLDIVIVDDEPADYESYAIAALDSISADFGVVSSATAYAASEGIVPFDKVIWISAVNEENPLSAEDISLISDLLDNGGNLYLSGWNIAYHLADPESPYYSANRATFLNQYLHSEYLLKDYDYLILKGIPNDPITGDISLTGLSGGTGGNTSAGNTINQIAPAGSAATPIFSFLLAANDYAGIKAIHNGPNGTGKVVFTSFGFESLAQAGARLEIIENMLQWFNDATGIEDKSHPGIVYQFKLKSNYPNPFNPETRISFTLPVNSGKENVSLVIYNQLGQKVKTLVNQPIQGGHYEVTWDGSDDFGRRVASGIYFYRLETGAFNSTRKMLLVK